MNKVTHPRATKGFSPPNSPLAPGSTPPLARFRPLGIISYIKAAETGKNMWPTGREAKPTGLH